jgi:UDP-N-acetylglucosamine 2-epimerase (non-hydrolysing)
MKIMSVVGARPNFMKVAPIIAAIRDHNERLVGNANGEVCASHLPAIEHVLVHTGQHYDQVMSGSFFSDLGLPKPDAHLGVGSGSHACQTADIMRKFEPVLLDAKPDVLVLVGDVNSTLACALVAAKISYEGGMTRPIIAHVEAGLRSFDRTMPEELNRILTDQLSDLLFVTEESGLRNLAREGVLSQSVHFVGNTMIDSLLAYMDKARESSIVRDLGLCEGRYALLTLHRPANVDSCDALLNIFEGLEELLEEWPVVFPAHPRTQSKIKEFGIGQRFHWPSHRSTASCASSWSEAAGLRITEPLGYVDFLCLMSNAALVVTDSGGIQEETTCLGVPCATLRENTERPVTMTVGTNILAGVRKEGIRAAVKRQLRSAPIKSVPDKWDGRSASRIVEVICEHVRSQFFLERSDSAASTTIVDHAAFYD